MENNKFQCNAMSFAVLSKQTVRRLDFARHCLVGDVMSYQMASASVWGLYFLYIIIGLNWILSKWNEIKIIIYITQYDTHMTVYVDWQRDKALGSNVCWMAACCTSVCWPAEKHDLTQLNWTKFAFELWRKEKLFWFSFVLCFCFSSSSLFSRFEFSSLLGGSLPRWNWGRAGVIRHRPFECRVREGCYRLPLAAWSQPNAPSAAAPSPESSFPSQHYRQTYESTTFLWFSIQNSD